MSEETTNQVKIALIYQYVLIKTMQLLFILFYITRQL